MSFQPANNRKDPNRKILEELHQKKQMLLKSGAGVVSPPSVPVANLASEAQASKVQCMVMGAAIAQSFAYYIPQESNFGNPILPVIPRFDKN